MKLLLNSFISVVLGGNEASKFFNLIQLGIAACFALYFLGYVAGSVFGR